MDMKKVLAVLLFAFVFMNCTSLQKNTKSHLDIIRIFEQNYNNDNFEQIYQSFSDEMKMALPVNSTIEFFANLKLQAGKIINWEPIAYQQNSYSYKTTFELNLFIINISIDSQEKISGLTIRLYEENNHPVLERNITRLILPFDDEWTVIWGGDTKQLNYHVDSEAQKNAFDFVITDTDNKTYKTDGKTNEDYYAFGRGIFAPCNGEIVLAVDGIKDNVPGKLNPAYLLGNSVILRTENNEYIIFAHLKQYSLMVKEGDRITQGELLGHCGNSGNSTEAHLHFHIQNIEDINEATGVKCYFTDILMNGNQMMDYSPIQKDKIKNKQKNDA
jgi:murein DD-endopeptidase MepM/ murein hydrolase activator NlpD